MVMPGIGLSRVKFLKKTLIIQIMSPPNYRIHRYAIKLAKAPNVNSINGKLSASVG